MRLRFNLMPSVDSTEGSTSCPFWSSSREEVPMTTPDPGKAGTPDPGKAGTPDPGKAGTPDPGKAGTPAVGQSQKVARRQRARLLAAAILGALFAAFAVLNLEDVKVNWLITSGQTPLILVIVISFALGLGADRLLVLRAGRRRKEPE
jgi:uncharacterized integral membrane protein